MKRGGKKEKEDLCFYLRALNVEKRVEPAVISGREEGGVVATRSVEHNRFCQLKGIFKPLSGKQVKVGPTYPYMNQTNSSFNTS